MKLVSLPHPTGKPSRVAEVVALALFTLGYKTSAAFRRPQNISPQCLEGLLELEKLRMIRILRGPDGWVCKPRSTIGFPMRDFAPIKPEETFSLMIN